MLTMTCVSDEALFIYGGLGMDGNTLGESSLLLLRLSCLSCGCLVSSCLHSSNKLRHGKSRSFIRTLPALNVETFFYNGVNLN